MSELVINELIRVKRSENAFMLHKCYEHVSSTKVGILSVFIFLLPGKVSGRY